MEGLQDETASVAPACGASCRTTPVAASAAWKRASARRWPNRQSSDRSGGLQGVAV